MSPTTKRTQPDPDADEAKAPPEQVKTKFCPKLTSDESARIEREDTPEREVEAAAAGKPLPRLELTYPSKTLSPGENGPPVPFQQPTPLTTFSYDSERELRFDDSSLRYYVDPPHGADLRHGYEKWIKRPEEKGRLDGLLRAWLRVRNGLPDEFMNGGVIAWRGVMTRILTAPYEEREGWQLNVMCVNGTVYLEEHISDAKLLEKENLTPHHRLQTYYGYSFESFCTSGMPHAKTGWGGDVDTNIQWCSVVKTKLGNTRLVIGGEVDCVRGKSTKTNDTLVELKTSLTIRGQQDESRFEKKLLKFYFQSFLLGVPEIIVGFRSPAGKLGTVQSFQTMQIPRMVRGKPGSWDPNVCLGWGERFLEFVKEAVQGDVHSAPDGVEEVPVVWRVEFKPGVGISMSQLGPEAVEEVQEGSDRYGFLPRWYWEGSLYNQA
ncbi:RAI1-domain-containing protein [Thelephora ganbajun]|uniref:RAI1-domain-containing protein n=1 Tax=Thelephora ganbajun TaxID=370292 RepID=A0ACB6Z3A3_THEGA|nr:RAI1-domain-containing protein [Thelephora ganbajun]